MIRRRGGVCARHARAGRAASCPCADSHRKGNSERAAERDEVNERGYSTLRVEHVLQLPHGTEEEGSAEECNEVT